MARMTGGEAVVRALLANGVDTIFGLPGVQNDALFSALRDDCPVLYRLGDAENVGRISDAVEQAITLAESL